MIVFREFNFDDFFFAFFNADKLFFKARNETSASEFKVIIFHASAFELNAVNAAFEIDIYNIFHFCRFFGIDNTRLFISLIVNFGFNLSLCDFINFFSYIESFILSEFDLRFDCNFKSKRNFAIIFKIEFFDFRTCDDFHVFFIRKEFFVSFRNNYIQCVFIKNAFSVKSFNDFSRSFALSETADIKFSLNFLISFFASRIKFCCISCKTDLNLAFSGFVNSVIHITSVK